MHKYNVIICAGVLLLLILIACIFPKKSHASVSTSTAVLMALNSDLKDVKPLVGVKLPQPTKASNKAKSGVVKTVCVKEGNSKVCKLK